jgi:hypothetical protein
MSRDLAGPCLTRLPPAPCSLSNPVTETLMRTDSVSAIDMNALPLLPLRDVVVFPHMVMPLFVGRPKSIKALDVAMDTGKHILLVAQSPPQRMTRSRRISTPSARWPRCCRC